MKAEYLNPVISSLANVLESLLQITPQRGKGIKKIEKMETEKDYTLLLEIEGAIKGYFSFGFSKNTAIAIIGIMTVGMNPTDEIDELGISCIQEMGSMTRGNMIKSLNAIGYDCEIKEVKLHKADELPKYDNQIGIQYPFDTKVGNIEINMSLYK